MRKFILAAIGCAAIFATSCNNKETTETTKPVDPTEIAGSYTSQNAHMKVNGTSYDLTGEQTITISGSDLEKMSVAIPAGVVRGEDAVTFTDVVFDSENNYAFTGVNTNNDRTLNLKGYYSANGLVAEITSEYKVSLVGEWNFMKPNIQMVGEGEDAEEMDLSKVFYTKFTTESDSLTFLGTKQPCVNLEGFFNNLGQQMIRTYDEEGNYTGALRNITFHADGNLTAEYNTNFMGEGAPVYATSPMGAMHWYVKANQVFLVPDLNMMTRAGLTTTGIPMEYKIENGVASIYFTKDQIAPVMALAGSLVGNLADDSFGGAGMFVKWAVTDLTTISAEATEFSFGICLEKSVAE